LYNTQIFYQFKQLIKATGRYQANEVEKGKVYMIYKSEEHAKREIRPRKYLVLVDLSQENYICICWRFQKDGILCVHILRTLIHVDVGANLTIHNVIVLMQTTLDLVPT